MKSFSAFFRATSIAPQEISRAYTSQEIDLAKLMAMLPHPVPMSAIFGEYEFIF